MIKAFTRTKQLVYSALGLGFMLSANGPAWGQCSSCGTVVDSNVGSYAPGAGSTVCIPAGTTYGGTIEVTQNGVTICNSGTFSGTLNVAAGVVGTVVNNVGTVATGNLRLNAPTTLNNGSSDGGTTVASGASWSGYLGGNVAATATINNYASWTAALQPLAGGTINNRPSATWDAYMTTSANLTITNAGAWKTQIQEASNSPTITITQNGGSWTGGLGGGSGSLRITNNATWTQGFNFPGGSANAFTAAAGSTTTLNSYLGMGGTVTLVNNGTMTMPNGMDHVGATSSLTIGASGTFAVTGDFVNDGTVLNRGALTASGNFFNNGTITGPAAQPGGQVRAGSYTVNNGSFGADGSYLDFCDGTPPTPASNGFDSRGGTVGSNVTFCAANSSTQPLPVTLTSFTATLRPEAVLLRWATASELNNKEFVLERSADGRQYQALQTLAGRGTALTASTYAATDAEPLPGRSYYRLRQVDFNGASSYSPVASVGRPTAITAYPNPTADGLTLDLRALPAGPCPVRLRSLPGQVVLAQILAGGQAQPLSLATLPAGTYLLEVEAASLGRSVQRIVKR
jgi:hypothetical protein